MRLVLGGGGPVVRAVCSSLATWSGAVRAVVPDERSAGPLRETGATVTVGDPADPATYPERAATVLVAPDVDDVRGVAARARERFPDALLVVVLPAGATDATDAPADHDAAIADVADRVVDPAGAMADAVSEVATGETADRLRRLRRVLRSVDGPLGIVAHDNPDPDAIGSAVALARIARSVGLEAVPCYGGEISHQENRALVNLLDLDLRRLEPTDEGVVDVDQFGSIALVDHSRPGVNDGLPADTRVDVVVDHHPPRAPVEARYVDLRASAGATSTLLAEYLDGYGVDPDPTVATALLFGIRVDTREFTREVSESDFEAAAYLVPHVDGTVLERVESPSSRPDVVDALARAISGREVRGETLVAGVGHVSDRDALAQAADRLLGMEGIDVVVVHGIDGDTVHVSGRARGGTVDLGEAFRDAFDSIGSAGGHADMAGAQISLGVLGAVENDALVDVVDDVVADRIFETLADAPQVLGSDEPSEFTFELPPEDP